MMYALIWVLALALVLGVVLFVARRKAYQYIQKILLRRRDVPTDSVSKGATGVAEAIDAMSRAGYEEAFHAVAGGLADTRGRFHRPYDLVVDDMYRFDEASDPDEQVLVYALRDPDAGIRGTYVTNYGPNASALDAEVLQALRN